MLEHLSLYLECSAKVVLLSMLPEAVTGMVLEKHSYDACHGVVSDTGAQIKS